MESFRSFAFGAFRLIPERQLLLRDEQPVRLGGRAIDLLSVLVERPGQLISKTELVSRAWPDTVVVDANLKVNMMALRRALDDGAGQPRFIATVTGRGYRFVADVQETAGQALPEAPKPRPARHHNLPVSVAGIFGRTQTIASLTQEIAISRLICLTGAGGIGKTTVALAVAEQCLGQFDDGVWLVDLSRSRDEALTAHAIATAVGMSNLASDVLAALCQYLRHRSVLLVLDNCEHLLPSVGACASALLAAAPGLKILATSREPLLVDGERVRRLHTLSAPTQEEARSAAQALKFPAVQLFVERATDKLESFQLSDADAPVVATICRRLDGLALAIEIAATRVDVLGVTGLLEQLDDRFRLLTGVRSEDARHRTLLATLDWSYELLSEDEAALLRAISVFAGPFDLDDAMAVLGHDLHEQAEDATQVMTQLVAKSLVVVQIDSVRSGNAVTYRLLESTRLHAQDKLRACPSEARATLERHAMRICQVMDEARRERASMPAPEWAARYGHRLDDLRNALAWVRTDAEQPRLQIRLTVAGMALWEHFSLTNESRDHFADALRQLEAAGWVGSSQDMQLSLGLGAASMYTQGQQAQAEAAMQRALRIAQQLGDTDCQLRCLMSISTHQMFAGRLRDGGRSLDLFASIAAARDPDILVASEIHHGVGEMLLGDLHSAIRRFESVQQRDFRQASASSLRYVLDPYALAGGILCQAQWLVGLPDTALRTARDCLAAGRASGHHLTVNNALSITCAVLYWTGRYEDCARNVRELEDHYARHGIVTRRPLAAFYRAAVDLATQGSSPAVIHALGAAIGDFECTHHLVRLPYYQSVLAQALLQDGRLAEATVLIESAVERAHAQEEGWCLAEVLRVQAAVWRAQGRSQAATELLRSAMTEADRFGTLAWRLRAATDAARQMADEGRWALATSLLDAVLDPMSEGEDTPDRAMAERLRASLQPATSCRP